MLIRIPGLGSDMSNSDSVRWHRRSERFLTAIKQHSPADTYQHYQPGVTLMWINSFVKQIGFSTQQQLFEETKTLENADYFPIIHGASKAVLVVILGFLLVYQMWLIKNIFSSNASLLFGILVIFEPYLIGIDRWFHLTSLETYLGMAAFLSLLYWFLISVEDRKLRKRFLFISSLFFVLAVLSKLTSLILGPVLVSILIADYSKNKSLRHIVLFSIFSSILFVGLFPSMWAEPVSVIYKLINAITNAVEGDIRGEEYQGLMSVFYYPSILMFKLSPITLLLFVASLVGVKKVTKEKSGLFVLIYLLSFLVLLTISDKKIDRYVVAIIMPLLLFVSIYLSKLSQSIKLIFVVAILAVFSWSFYVYYPLFSSYHSPIFGIKSISRALKYRIYDNSGEYYAPAARHLNDLGRDKYTWVPYNIEAFSHYYKGNLQRDFDENTDFVVTSVNHLDDVIENCPDLEKSFGTRFESVVFVFSCK